MNGGRQCDSAHDLAALHATGALGADECAEIERRIASGDEILAEAVAGWSQVVLHLASAAPPLQPRPEIRDLLLARIAGQALSAELSGGDASPGAPPAPAAVRSDAPAPPMPPTAEETGQLVVLRAERARWRSLADGIEARTLFVDARAGRATLLVRMAAGIVYQPHYHDGVEECFVLDGDLRVGEFVLGPGDYQRAPAGTWHGMQSTLQGCLCLVIARA
jgi:quercetin dioxygenase-like cupin family protein